MGDEGKDVRPIYLTIEASGRVSAVDAQEVHRHPTQAGDTRIAAGFEFGRVNPNLPHYDSKLNPIDRSAPVILTHASMTADEWLAFNVRQFMSDEVDESMIGHIAGAACNAGEHVEASAFLMLRLVFRAGLAAEARSTLLTILAVDAIRRMVAKP